jgi:hypothetical protein
LRPGFFRWDISHPYRLNHGRILFLSLTLPIAVNPLLNSA